MRGHSDFLAALTPADQAALRKVAVPVRYAAGKLLMRAGERGRHVVIIERGWVWIRADSPHGSEATLAIRGPGDLVGEMSIVGDVPRMANVQAKMPVEGLVVRATDFLAVLEASPTAAMATLRVLAARLRDADRHRVGLGGARSDRRVQLALVDLAVQRGHDLSAPDELTLDVSREELARFSRLSLSSVARALSRLRSAGVLAQPGSQRGIIVRRPHRLRAMAAGLDSLDSVPDEMTG